MTIGFRRIVVVVGLWMSVVCSIGLAASPKIVSTKLQDFELTDFRGRNWTLNDFPEDSFLVVAFLGTECPLAQFYATRLNAMAEKYSTESVRVIGVMSNRQDSLEEIAAFARRRDLSYPVVKDPANRFADQVGAERTPEVFVYDSERNLRYRGRVDDERGVAHQGLAPRRRDLRLAIDDLLAGREVSVPKTEASGCIISRTKDVATEGEITYGTHIAKILRKNCVGCHRENELAPFSLTDGEESSCWADMIVEVIREDRMPPWHADDKHEQEYLNQQLIRSHLILAPARITRPCLPAPPMGYLCSGCQITPNT